MNSTVVISNYNYAQFLPSAIESCLDQNVPCKIIVVDDHSEDDSWPLVIKYAKKYKSLSGVRLKQNSGGNARGKNVGISLSKTNYVTCLDSDDMLLPGSIGIRENIFATNPMAGWVHGMSKRLVTTDEYSEILEKIDLRPSVSFSGYRKLKSVPESDILWYEGVEASTVLCRREIYDKVGLYDEDLKWKIDREMWSRFLYNNIKKVWIKKFVSIYRHHKNQVTKNKNIKQCEKINKHFYKIRRIRAAGITEGNTLLIKNYDPYEWIEYKIGDFT